MAIDAVVKTGIHISFGWSSSLGRIREVGRGKYLKQLLNVEPSWCSQMILGKSGVACPWLHNICWIKAIVHVTRRNAHLLRLHAFYVLCERLQDRLGLLCKANVLLLLGNPHLQIFARVLDLLLELKQLLEGVVEEHYLSRRLVRQCFSNLFEFFHASKQLYEVDFYVLKGPDIALFILHLVGYRVFNQLKAMLDRYLDWAACVLIDPRGRHAYLGSTCS